MYFGKTVNSDPVKYQGSGTLWKRHIKKHGAEHVITLWHCQFDDIKSIVEFALDCSTQWGIVESDTWLNLIPENGLDGGVSGMIMTGKRAKGVPKTGKKAKGMPATGKGAKGVPKTGAAAKGVPRGPATGGNAKGVPKTGKRAKGMPRGPQTGKRAKGVSIGPGTGGGAKGVPKPKHECPHCGEWMSASMLSRWHGDNCKLRELGHQGPL